MLDKFEINGIIYPVVDRSSIYDQSTDTENPEEDVIYYWLKGDESHPWFKASATLNGMYFEGIGNDGSSFVHTPEDSLIIALNDIKDASTVEIINADFATRVINEQDETTKEGLEAALDMAIRYIESLEFEKYKLQLELKKLKSN